jgi:predicted permease
MSPRFDKSGNEPMWRRYLRFYRPDPAADLEDEFRDHLASTEESLRLQGYSAADAREEAHRRFGDIGRFRHETNQLDHTYTRRVHMRDVIESFLQDVRYAARGFRRSPVFTVVAALSIALAVAANSTIFSVINAVLLRPVPGTTDDRLVRVYQNHHSAFEWDEFQWFRERTTSFEHMIGERNHAMALRTSNDATTQRIRSSIVTRGYFEALGVRFALGQGFNSNDSVATSDALVAVLTHRFWQNNFGSDSSIIGRTVSLSGQPVKIVGVAAPEFRGSVAGWSPQLFVPLSAIPLLTGVSLERTDGNFYTIAQLRRGTSRDAAAAELSAHMVQLARTDSARYERRTVRLDHVRGVNAELRTPAAAAAAFAMAMVGMVLLIACANVANLLLARATARQGEIGIRLAIGASRKRIIRQLLTESFLLAMVAGVLGFAASMFITRFIGAAIPAEAGIDNAFFRPDSRVILFTGVLSVGTTMLFGLFPALRAARPDVVPMLKGIDQAPAKRRRRGGLIAAQAALCVVLLALGSMFGRSMERVRDHNPGFESKGIVDVTVDLRLLNLPADVERTMYDRLLSEIRSMPDVQSATLAALVPLSGSTNETRIVPDGQSGTSRFDFPIVAFNTVTEDYFETLSIPMQRGRGFTVSDRPSSARVAVVNETAARTWWPNTNPIGKRFRFGGLEGELVEVVGVARDADYNMPGEQRRPFIYMPLSQNHRSDAILQVRSTSDVNALRTRIWETMRGIAPALPPAQVTTFDEDMFVTTLPMRAGRMLAGVLGIMSLLLVATGIYGVTAYAVARRTREIGIRAALGANRRQLLQMVVASSLRPVTRGAVVGLVLSMLAAYGLSKVVYGVQAADPVVLAGVSVVIAGVAFIASVLPARAASRVSPVDAMRVG